MTTQGIALHIVCVSKQQPLTFPIIPITHPPSSTSTVDTMFDGHICKNQKRNTDRYINDYL